MPTEIPTPTPPPVPPSAPANTPEPPRTPVGKAWHFFKVQIWPIMWMIGVLCCIRSSLADWNAVPTGSMNPTIIEGDRIYVNKLAYGLRFPFSHWWLATWGEPKRGEIVTFTNPQDGIVMVKRVVGMPGDVVDLRNNVLTVNGIGATYSPNPIIDPDLVPGVKKMSPEQWTELLPGVGTGATPITHPILLLPRFANPNRDFHIVVPDGQYFLMGDSRDNSRDSRWWGCCPRSLILGRSKMVILSCDYDDMYLPRSGRWFRTMP